MKHVAMLWLVVLVLSISLLGCDEQAQTFESQLSRTRVDLTHFRDEQGRYVHFRGTNLGGSTKVPYEVNADDPHDFTYVGRPFPLEEADARFEAMRQQGFNSIRLLFMWESVTPDSPDDVDEEFLDYFEQIIAKANEYGIYVLINMHENMWSRFLYSYYNEDAKGEKGGLENMLWSMFPKGDWPETVTTKRQVDEIYTDRVKGDGAPFWATKACLPEKNFDSPYWGVHRFVGRLKGDKPEGSTDADWTWLEKDFLRITWTALLGYMEIEEQTAEQIESMLREINTKLPPDGFELKDTTDFLPWTFWGTNVALSLDVERCYAAFFAGEDVYPGMMVDDAGAVSFVDPADDAAKQGKESVEEYLQKGYERAWVEVAKRAAKYPNVIGYDIMNEPTSVFIVLAVSAAYFQLLEGSVQGILEGLLGSDPIIGETTVGRYALDILKAMQILPPTKDQLIPKDLAEEDDEGNTVCSSDECKAEWDAIWEQTQKDWGFYGADLMKMVGLNSGFGKNYLKPLYERVGAAIMNVDPNAVIWLEPAFSPDMLLGGEGGGLGGMWQNYMPLPDLDVPMVYSPHWYPDIYPNLGFNQPPRIYRPDEFSYRDYSENLAEKADYSVFALENVPVVFGEFGTYWNYRYTTEEDQTKPGYQQSRENNYKISAEILDNYYEAFESLFMSNMVWCYTTDNDPKYGDLWNHEDFSIVDENVQPRGAEAWMRPYPKALSGKPISTHFYGPLHYFDPDKGKPNALREFDLVFASKETDAPTIIYVPDLQYPDGFYVWLSDGWAAWDGEHQELYYHPTNDDPDCEHHVTIRPPIDGQEIEGWKYFIDNNDMVLTGR